MNLELTEEQVALRDTVRRFLAEKASVAGHVRPLLDDPKLRWDRPAYTQVQHGDVPGYSVRTERWRYTEWNDGKDGAELYDHDADPQELKNLVGVAKSADTIKQMKELLHKQGKKEK